jgi:iron-sulfur cluster assembly protein/iron-sulfur cluster insertion protein
VSTTIGVSIGGVRTRPAVIALTDSAVAKVAELITQEGNPQLALRVAVRPGGCSGFSYEMFFDSDLADDDISTTVGAVKVIVDAVSAPLLEGATLDYKDGLQGAGFHITNPQASRTCGCGNSFS